MISPTASVQEQIDFFFPSDTHPYRILDRKIDAAVTPSSCVLEIGCGRTAPCLRRLRGQARKLYGIDLVSFAIEENDLILMNESAASMESIDDDMMDLVFSRSVMEHIENPEAVLREVFRVLNPGGRYVFLTPNRYDYASIIASLTPNRFHSSIVRMTEGRSTFDTFPTFYRANSFSRIRELSEHAGLEIEELIRLGQYPSYLQFSRVLFWFGCLYEKGLEKTPALDCLKGWILCTLRKPLS